MFRGVFCIHCVKKERWIIYPPSEHVYVFVTCHNATRSPVYIYIHIHVSARNRATAFDVRRVATRVSVCVRARSRDATVGSPLKKSLSFPHSQGAASHTYSVRLLLYIHTPVKLVPARSTNNSSEKNTKKHPRNAYWETTLPCPLFLLSLFLFPSEIWETSFASQTSNLTELSKSSLARFHFYIANNQNLARIFLLPTIIIK